MLVGFSDICNTPSFTRRDYLMVATKPQAWDREVDVIVLGSGGAAMTSAILAADQGA